jgi:hypothetical protein
VNGTWHRLLKDPKTDSGKKSLSGLIRCRENEKGELEVFDALIEGIHRFEHSEPGWRLWSRDGYRTFSQSFDEVRARAQAD